MSNWTHVAAVIRIDDLRFMHEPYDFDKLIGKEVYYDDAISIWDDAEKYPKNYLPMGSEGSLHKSVWINPSEDSLSAYTVSIFGDLRDHDNPQEIVEWFKSKVENLSVRQATITVRNERNGTVNWAYED